MANELFPPSPQTTETALPLPVDRSWSARIFGDPATVELERRLFAGCMLVALVSGVVAAVQSLIIGTGLRMVLPAVAATIVSGGSFWLTRRMQAWRRLITPFFVFTLALLAASWLTEAGTSGTIAFYFFLLACYAVIFFDGAARPVAVGALLATVAALSLVEYWFPSFILPYNSASARFSDVVLTLLLCLFLLTFFVYRVYGEYQRERAAKDELLRLMTAEKERVEQSMRDKQRLLSIVSHDIANALTVLRGEIGLSRMPGRDGAVPPESLERMERACCNIGEIIGSVRMIEAVEQGLLKFEPKRVDLQDVFATAEMLFSDRLRERTMRIVFPKLTDENRFVMADPRILANHVFSNLVSNAIRFSYPGATITVSVERQGALTAIRVQDPGIGMPRKLVRRLFDLQAKTTRPGTDGQPGTGFGMRTVKSFVDLFGGTISVESKTETDFPSDHGTAVTVRLSSAAL